MRPSPRPRHPRCNDGPRPIWANRASRPDRTAGEAAAAAPAVGLPAERKLSLIALQSDPVRLTGRSIGAQERILTPEAVRFLVKLASLFEPRRRRLLEARRERQEELDRGQMPHFRGD